MARAGAGPCVRASLPLHAPQQNASPHRSPLLVLPAQACPPPLPTSHLSPASPRSPKTEEGIKGGVVLLRLAPPEGGMRPLTLEVTYEDREGKSFRWVRYGAGSKHGDPLSPAWCTRCPHGSGHWHAAIEFSRGTLRCSTGPSSSPALLHSAQHTLPIALMCSSKRAVDISPEVATSTNGGALYQSSGVRKVSRVGWGGVGGVGGGGSAPREGELV